MDVWRPCRGRERVMKDTSRTIQRWRGQGSPEEVSDELAVEEPLEIRVDTRSISVTMRTPGHDEELAIGFLVTEGILQRREQVQEVRRYPRNELGNVVDVFLTQETVVDFARLTRHVFATSSCGLCGKTSLEAVQGAFPPIVSGLPVSRATLLSLPGRMRAHQATFDRTGGLHAAALFSMEGELRVLREDIGRHNAVDKVIGHTLMRDAAELSRSLLLVSGRASFEILQKALAAGIPSVAAISAPSSLAVDFAQASGQLLVGFLRGDHFNVYAGAERIQDGPST